ncbi:MAG: riboflavin biosynthesis protein RibF [Candidatus Cryptobacteroides sp.]
MVVATGFFDGVHLGHRLVIEQLVAAAKARGDESLVITFWPHPRNVLQQDARTFRLLTTLEEKKELLYSLGVDHVEVIPFTREFSRLTMAEYLKEYVMERYGGKTIVLGYDNRIGCDAKGAEDVVRTAISLGIEVIRAGYAAPAGTVVSSTWIRTLLEVGDVTSAASMLGYPYSLKGVVIAGDRIGRTMGFPTANMQLYEPMKLVPANGVYSVGVKTLGCKFMGMCNIGRRPTVSSSTSTTIETNIFDFDEDIYGLDLEITFIKRIREEVKFSSVSELKAQLEQDRKYCIGLSE